MKSFLCIILTAGLLFALQACGTIIHGTTQQVAISSNPGNASVTINGLSMGQTPMLIDLKRKDTHFVKIELPGYAPYETFLSRQVSGWIWGNIVFGGLIGVVVDAASGGMYKLTPEQVQAELRGRHVHFSDSEQGVFIAVVFDVHDDWIKLDQLQSMQ